MRRLISIMLLQIVLKQCWVSEMSESLYLLHFCAFFYDRSFAMIVPYHCSDKINKQHYGFTMLTQNFYHLQ